MGHTTADMTHTFREMLAQPDALAQLRTEMIELRLDGLTKPEIYAALESLRLQVDTAQDAILLEAIDILVGFCRPQ
jgi:hypothetical protein